MTDDEGARHLLQETINRQLYRLSLFQTEAIMQLSHALRSDPNVSEQTRAEAEQVWANIEDMIGMLKSVSKLNGLNGTEESADE